MLGQLSSLLNQGTTVAYASIGILLRTLILNSSCLISMDNRVSPIIYPLIEEFIKQEESNENLTIFNSGDKMSQYLLPIISLEKTPSCNHCLEILRAKAQRKSCCITCGYTYSPSSIVAAYFKASCINSKTATKYEQVSEAIEKSFQFTISFYADAVGLPRVAINRLHENKVNKSNNTEILYYDSTTKEYRIIKRPIAYYQHMLRHTTTSEQLTQFGLV